MNAAALLRNAVAAGLGAAFLTLGAGCAMFAPPVREPLPVIVWPTPPEVPRIAFVNSVSQPEDMGIEEGLAQGLYRFLIGSQPIPLSNPHGLAADAEGRLYVADGGVRKVHVYDPRANRHETWPQEGIALVSPIGVAVDERRGRIYVSDSVDAVVRVFARDGTETAGGIRSGSMGRPTGLAVNAATDELLVVDTVNAAVLRFSLADHSLKGVVGAEGEEQGRFHSPTHVAVSGAGDFYVTDALNHRVQVFAPDGKFRRMFGSPGDGPGHFSRPKGVAADSDGNIYVVDALFDNVQVFDASGALLMSFGGPGQRYGEFWLPTGIFIDSRDMIYVADSYNKRVQIFHYLKNGEPQ